jgi:hypothetical protein
MRHFRRTGQVVVVLAGSLFASDGNAGGEVRCASPGSEACVVQCEGVGAYCVHRAVHPYSPSSGVGDLYWCKGGTPTWTCSYQYSNGDNCTRIYPGPTWLCRYIPGKSEASE